jgi:Zn-finger protein
MKPSSEYFSNVDCEYYPCHALEGLNCLFCYCPLYFLDCGGDFTIAGGVKDCSRCLKPHDENGYRFVREGLAREIRGNR